MGFQANCDIRESVTAKLQIVERFSSAEKKEELSVKVGGSLLQRIVTICIGSD